MRTAALLLVMSTLAFGALAVGCRSLENAGSDLDRGFRDTQQDLQHGIRGEPDPSGPPPAASSAPPARPASPPGTTTGAAPAPAPTSSGVTL